MFLYPHISIVFTSHQGKQFFLQHHRTLQRHYRKLQPINMQSCEAQSHWIHLQNIPTFKVPGTLQKRGWKDCKSRRIREFGVRLFLLVTSATILIKSYQHDYPNVTWTRRAPTNIKKYMGEKHKRSQPNTKNYRQWGKLGAG